MGPLDLYAGGGSALVESGHLPVEPEDGGAERRKLRRAGRAGLALSGTDRLRPGPAENGLRCGDTGGTDHIDLHDKTASKEAIENVSHQESYEKAENDLRRRHLGPAGLRFGSGSGCTEPVVIREESEAAGQTSDFASSQGTASDTMEQKDPVPSAPPEDAGEVQEDEASVPPARTEQEHAPASSAATGSQDDADGQNAQSIKPADNHAADTSIFADAVRGDTELILARGGTLLPDNDLGSYREVNGTFYKLFAAKGSTPNVVRVMAEYEVGNWEILTSSEQKIASETLVNGEYPQNSGEKAMDPVPCKLCGLIPQI